MWATVRWPSLSRLLRTSSSFTRFNWTKKRKSLSKSFSMYTLGLRAGNQTLSKSVKIWSSLTTKKAGTSTLVSALENQAAWTSTMTSALSRTLKILSKTLCEECPLNDSKLMVSSTRTLVNSKTSPLTSVVSTSKIKSISTDAL